MEIADYELSTDACPHHEVSIMLNEKVALHSDKPSSSIMQLLLISLESAVSLKNSDPREGTYFDHSGLPFIMFDQSR